MGIGHLHECGLVYGEVALDQFLVNHDGHILLIEMGSSRKYG